jgi:biopolymer transport protein ExbD
MAAANLDGDGDSISLNIMPMLDIFSILILFLLMNFSTDPISHDLNKAIELPDSLTSMSLDEVPTVVFSKENLYVQENKIFDLEKGEIPSHEISQGAVKKVYEELKKLADASQRLSKKAGKTPPPLTIEVDKTHKYMSLKRIFVSAQQAEFFKFKIMVSKEIQ